VTQNLGLYWPQQECIYWNHWKQRISSSSCR